MPLNISRHVDITTISLTGDNKYRLEYHYLKTFNRQKYIYFYNLAFLQTWALHAKTHTHTHIYIYSICEVNIWNVNRLYETAFVFYSGEDAIEKESLWKKSLRKKMLSPKGAWTLQPSVSCPCFDIWSTRGIYFKSHTLKHWLWWYRYFLFVKFTFQISAVHTQQHPLAEVHETDERVFVRTCRRFLNKIRLDPMRDLNLQPSDLWRMLYLFSYWSKTLSIPYFIILLLVV